MLSDSIALEVNSLSMHPSRVETVRDHMVFLIHSSIKVKPFLIEQTTMTHMVKKINRILCFTPQAIAEDVTVYILI